MDDVNREGEKNWGDSRSKLRWYQFSLRTLLIVVTLFAVACSWFAVKWQQAKRQKEAVDALGIPPSVIYDYEYDPAIHYRKDNAPELKPTWLVNLLGIDFFANVVSATAIDDADLQRLQSLPKLQYLELTPQKPGQFTEMAAQSLAEMKALRRISFGCHIVTGMIDVGTSEMIDEDFRILAGLRQITELDFGDGGGAITDEGMKHLTGLSNLTTLNLRCTQITGLGLENLKDSEQLVGLYLQSCKEFSDAGMTNLKWFPKLKYLSLEDTDVTDAGLENLTGLTELQYLDLGSTNVTDDGLIRLSGLARLRKLDLQYTKVTDAGLKHLNGPSIQRLILDGNQISDSGLEHLGALSHLQGLSVKETQVTAAGLRNLKRFKTLRWLSIDEGLAKDGEIKQLQDALPGLKIVPSDWDWTD